MVVNDHMSTVLPSGVPEEKKPQTMVFDNTGELLVEEKKEKRLEKASSLSLWALSGRSGRGGDSY